ncbi:Acyl-CoA hydrolase [Thermanaeromonas toyohensis ToBE]|uniref:Acyl-CoA hydrolase n=1 Tax=Thermanaeromonas toyohensis ToBE TaxID=698762 RepID=A0A1W1W1C9_9FIRM|nr:acetyl-CoA hydrolase/transferase C-terminal domain-containing protein [Thermanaeromonas toyohensis]SMB99181.1 Acyl-CoA hydrolase [Thermanaeromonas toyohensis ToBE]
MGVNYKEQYRRKLISIDEAVGMVTSNCSIAAAMAASAPPGLLGALGKRRDEVENVRVFSALLLREFDFFLDPSMKGHFILESWFYGANERKGHELGTVSLIPSHGRDWGPRKARFDPPDFFWGTACPMDRHGYFSLSLGVGYEKDLMAVAKTVILEINPNLPRTYGDTQVHISQVDYVVEYEAPLVEIQPIEPSEEERAIGSYIADLIEDGSTIQLGIGGIPNAIAKFLMNKKDLGVHTEMFTDGMVDLVEAGVITGRCKTLWPGKMVGNFALGTRKLYDFINENLAVEFQPGRVTNDPCIIARNYKMVSVNTALQVDLTGQVVSESLGHFQYSGTGGQTDTAIGAQMSPGGKSIIALRSTAKGGTISTIVPCLPEGAKVTLLRADVDYVVTEYGVAHLKARSIRERVKQLINIAHPDFRAELRDAAKRLKLW